VTPFYEDDLVTLYHGKAEDVLPELGPVDHVITAPPYSERVHGAVRRQKIHANDRGGRYGADVRRNVDLGFEYLTPELRTFCAGEFARIARRWVLAFSDVESDHLWRRDLVLAGLDYVCAARLGRRVIGIEQERAHCETAVRRLAQGILP